jgi:cation diffusion facilitator family transporter
MEITRRAALLSFIASVVILALKVYAYLQTRSTAVLSDALESIVNVIAAGVALVVMRAVSEPADEEHPYGHGKLEYFSSTFEGGLITFAGIMIAGEAVKALFFGNEPRNLDTGLLISVVAASANLGLGLYLLAIGRHHKSEALTASAHHVLSDVWSTVGAVAGLGLVKLTGLSWFDPLAALVIAAQLSYSGFKIVRRSLGGLMDEVEEQTLKDLAFAFEKHRRAGVVDIHLTKMIRGGRFHHIDCHLVVPEFWKIAETHELMDSFEKDVVSTYPFDGEINFHVDPCERDYCSVCELVDCQVRQRAFEGRRVFTATSLVQRPQRDQLP